MAIILFDLDRTLLDCNSGSLWLKHEVKTGRVSRWDAFRAAYWFAKYHLGWSNGLQEAFREAARTYRGDPDSELKARSERFFEEQVRLRARPGALQALEHHRAQGDRCVLASSTTQYLASLACETWGLELGVNTVLETVDGVLTGEVASMALGQEKLHRAVEWFGEQSSVLEQATFYTDSATDIGLLERVGTPVAINPDGRLRSIAQRRGWRIEDWGSAA